MVARVGRRDAVAARAVADDAVADGSARCNRVDDVFRVVRRDRDLSDAKRAICTRQRFSSVDAFTAVDVFHVTAFAR